MNNKRYIETIALCTDVQKNKDAPNWTSLYEFDKTSQNKEINLCV